MTDPTDWFEQLWEQREVTLYPSLFGPDYEGIFPVPDQLLEETGISDPRWATCGVFRFAPTAIRPTWVYVSSGLSNEWFKEKPVKGEPAGFGCEFVLECPEKAEWPIRRLHHLISYQIGLFLGRFGNLETLRAGSRISLGKALDFADGDLNHLLLVSPTRFSNQIFLGGGIAQLVQLYAISARECEFAKTDGNELLIRWLQEHTSFPTIETKRKTMPEKV